MMTVDRRIRDRSDLAQEAAALLAGDYRLALVACHDDRDSFRIVYVFAPWRGALVVEVVVHVPADDAWVPSIADISPTAGLFEREIYDLYGVRPDGHPQPYRLVRHAHWPQGWHPMLGANANANTPAPRFEREIESFPFVEVEGPGVYEIAVGPIHAGIIEPGHFRFSVVGETIIRVEPRLWFLHRGIEKLFEGQSPAEAVGLAEQISGDTSIGHSLAFVMAVESAAQIEVPTSAKFVRGLLLEMERLYNHVTDLGALANDAGFGIANIHAQRIREQLMRLNLQLTGHRLLRGCITVGGAQLASLPDPAALLGIANAVKQLARITLDHSIVRDRFVGTSVLPPDRALQLGTLGYAARASGVNVDARRDMPFIDLAGTLAVAEASTGDVMGRYQVRADEFVNSVAICLELTRRLHGNLGNTTAGETLAEGSGLSFVEAWRGTITHRVELTENGKLARVKIVDPSFVNWQALPIALTNTIVPDFPLTNKSFNLSYAGNDL
jgi:Ni,Fe-hydrogenase III large subunit/Ni,Fe-hydrogenase III component G